MILRVAKQNKFRRDNQTSGERSNSNVLGKPFFKIFEILSKFIAYITQAIMQMVEGMTDMLNSLYKKALSAVLRSAFGVMLVVYFSINGL